MGPPPNSFLLKEADLRGAHLQGKDLSYADLQ
jgi:uncharacterized protein YjbI with pentapeptide repeats